MKIILINNLYKPYARGGAEKVVENITRGLLDKGKEVKIITTRPFFSRGPIFEKETNIYYLRSFYYNLISMPKFLRFFWHILDIFWPGDFWRTWAILRREKPDLVISHNLKGVGLLARAAIKSLRIKHIHTLHDIQLLHPSGLMVYGEEEKIENFSSRIYAFLSKIFIGSPDFVVSPSAWLMRLHEERGFFKKSKKYIIPNPIDLIIGNISRDNQKGDGVDFLYVGQIENHKGISFLVESFENINSGKLTIVGDGSILNKLKKDKGGNNIVFLGRKNKDEVAELMRRADCLIVPSLCYENSPIVIYEAFASGLPVLASKLGGITELLAPEFLFEAGNSEDLANKINWFKENKILVAQEAVRNRRLVEELKTGNYIKKIINL